MLHFEVQEKQGQRADYTNSVLQPSMLPAFVLVFNDDWNDYSYRTWFCLFYFDKDGKRNKLGEFKLMRKECQSTFEALPKKFDGPLSDDYCSLAIEPDYYSAIYNLFKGTNIIDKLLTSLRDCAYNHNIYEEFIEDECFKTSLLREDSSEQAVFEAPFFAFWKRQAGGLFLRCQILARLLAWRFYCLECTPAL